MKTEFRTELGRQLGELIACNGWPGQDIRGIYEEDPWPLFTIDDGNHHLVVPFSEVEVKQGGARNRV